MQSSDHSCLNYILDAEEGEFNFEGNDELAFGCGFDWLT